MRMVLKSLKRYLKLYAIFFKFSFALFLNYRFDLFMSSIANLTWTAGQLISVKFMFETIPSFAGWGVSDLVLLLGIGQVYVYLTFSLLDVNLDRLAEQVISGTFDFNLLKPVNLWFITAFRQIAVAQSLSFFITAVPMIIYGLSLGNYNLERLWLALVVLSLGVVILFLLRIALSSLTFVFDDITSLKNMLFNELADFNRVPLFVLPRALEALLTFVIPVAFIAYYPLLVIRGEAAIIVVVLVELVLVLLAYALAKLSWSYGLKQYSGVG